MRPCSYEPHNRANLLVFLVVASVKILESKLSLTTTTNRFYHQYRINPDVLGVDMFPNLGSRASPPSHLNTKEMGGGQKGIYLIKH